MKKVYSNELKKNKKFLQNENPEARGFGEVNESNNGLKKRFFKHSNNFEFENKFFQWNS